MAGVDFRQPLLERLDPLSQHDVDGSKPSRCQTVRATWLLASTSSETYTTPCSRASCAQTRSRSEATPDGAPRVGRRPSRRASEHRLGCVEQTEGLGAVVGEVDARLLHVLAQVGHSSSQLEASNPSGSGSSSSKDSQSARITASSSSPARRTFTAARGSHEVLGGEVLERIEAAAERVHIRTVEEMGRLAQDEVAGGPRTRTGEVAGEEPLGRPGAEAAYRRQASTHLIVGGVRERAEVEVGPSEPDDVLGLAPRVAKRDELVGSAPARRSRRGKAKACCSGARRNARSGGCGSHRPSARETCCEVIKPTRLSNGSG